MRTCIARVARGPRFQCPLLSFQIPGEIALVEGVDEEALDVAGPIAQAVGLECALPRQGGLTHRAVEKPDLCMAVRKIGIERDRTLEERQGLDPAG